MRPGTVRHSFLWMVFIAAMLAFIPMKAESADNDSFTITVTLDMTGIPVVSTITPVSGSTISPRTITITGSKFFGGTGSANVTSIKLSDGTNLAIGNVINDILIEGAIVPAGVSPGVYDVIVTTSQGANFSSAQKYTIKPGPVVTSITPASGFYLNNTAVTITGSGFYGGSGSSVVTRVLLSNGTPLDSFNVVSDTLITGVIPVNIPTGAYDVWVETTVDRNLTSSQKYTSFDTLDSITILILPEKSYDLTIYPNNKKQCISIKTGTFSEPTYLTFSKSTAPASNNPTIDTTTVAFDLTIDSKQNVNYLKYIDISMYYKASDCAGKDKRNMAIGRWDEVNSRWIQMPTTLYPDEYKLVTSTRYLAKFAIIFKVAAANLDKAVAYPNPFDPNKDTNGMIFDNLTADATIRIYTAVTGQFLRELTDPTGDGRIIWDGKNQFGKNVASGVYLAVIKSATGSKRLKIIVER